METIYRLFTEIYDSHVEDISELKSFDDQNFLIKYRTETGDSKCCIFKCVSGTDPDRVQHLQSQVEFMRFLKSKGFVCSQPVAGKDGTILYRKDLLKSKGKELEFEPCFVYVLTYLPGKVILDKLRPASVLIELGELLAHIHVNTQDYVDKDLDDNAEDMWQLQNIKKLKDVLSCVKNENWIQLVLNVIDEFENKVRPVINQLPQGAVWNDFHDENIILLDDNTSQAPSGVRDVKHLYGLIDFGDLCKSCYLFDLAIAITYLMIDSTDVPFLDVPKHFLHGYFEVNPHLEFIFSDLNLHTSCNAGNVHIQLDFELFELLFLSICGRYCQSLVLGLYSHQFQPDNDYILCTQHGWPQLQHMMELDRKMIYKRWFEN